MSKGALIAFAGGLLVVAVILGIVVYVKDSSRLVPGGSIVKVRTQAIDEQNSLAVLEVRLANNSDQAMVVRQLEVTLLTKDGHELPGSIVSAADTKNIFKYYPALGEQYNEPLIVRDRVAPHETMDRMLAVRFETPESDLRERKRITVNLEDVSGATAALTTK